MLVGAMPGPSGASDDDFEGSGQRDDEERCGRPHAGLQSGLNCGAALGALFRLRRQLLLCQHLLKVDDCPYQVYSARGDLQL